MPRQSEVAKKKMTEEKQKVEQSKPEPAKKQSPKKEVSVKEKDNTVVSVFEKVRLNEEGLQIPVGNGGSTERYTWTQTIDECSVLVGVGDLKGKELDVSIKPTSIVVRSKNPGPDGNVKVFLEGELTEKIDPSESTWTLEGGVLVLVLYKSVKTFWETILKGDPKIDTSEVDSRRHIDEYDDTTQAQIRKIIFDQSQSRKGLPTSDELGSKQPVVPPLPTGVEYIDQKTLDEHANKPAA
jgi:hypothetical protein